MSLESLLENHVKRVEEVKYTGIVRRIDDLGRVVITKKLREQLNIKEGDPLEFFTRGNDLIIRKYDTKDSTRREANES